MRDRARRTLSVGLLSLAFAGMTADNTSKSYGFIASFTRRAAWVFRRMGSEGPEIGPHPVQGVCRVQLLAAKNL